MVSVQLGLPVPTALVRMRARAFARGTSMDDLAAAVLAGRERLDEETP
ncbi:MAG: hypothetical protein JWN17_1384 [Frankiales bacterium]|nr:hypothetical protein [Frankiales bacterium]